MGLYKLGFITRTLDGASAENSRYPLNNSQISPTVLGKLGEDYLTYLGKMATGNWQRIVDKMPINFVFVGLIKLLFPMRSVIPMI